MQKKCRKVQYLFCYRLNTHQVTQGCSVRTEINLGQDTEAQIAHY